MIPHSIRSELRAVLLDMDGVLCASFPFLKTSIARFFQDTYDVSIEGMDLSRHAGAGEESYLRGIAQEHDLVVDIEAGKQQVHNLYVEAIQDNMPPLPGVVRFIEHCRSLSLASALVTSSERPKMEANLRETGIHEEIFAVVVTREESTRPKPDPGLYQLAIQKLGVEADQCLVVEDAPNGIAAAKKAGCSCLAVTTSFDEPVLTAAGADWVVPNLEFVKLDPSIEDTLTK